MAYAVEASIVSGRLVGPSGPVGFVGVAVGTLGLLQMLYFARGGRRPVPLPSRLAWWVLSFMASALLVIDWRIWQQRGVVGVLLFAPAWLAAAILIPKGVSGGELRWHRDR